MPSQRDIVPKLRNIWRPYCTIERSDIRIFFDHMRFYSTGSGFHGNLILCKTWIITQYASIVTILTLSRCITRSKNKYAAKSRRLSWIPQKLQGLPLTRGSLTRSCIIVSCVVFSGTCRRSSSVVSSPSFPPATSLAFSPVTSLAINY